MVAILKSRYNQVPKGLSGVVGVPRYQAWSFWSYSGRYPGTPQNVFPNTILNTHRCCVDTDREAFYDKGLHNIYPNTLLNTHLCCVDTDREASYDKGLHNIYPNTPLNTPLLG